MSRLSVRRPRHDGESGQSVVEFSLLVPIFMMILFGMIEFGFVFTHQLTVEYATREGARAGAALGNGGGTQGCAGTTWKAVDPLVIAAVERVLQSPGSQVVISNVSQIVIYKANPVTGANDQGLQNVWVYAPGSGPIPQGSTDKLDFVNSTYPNTDQWKACARSSSLPNPNSLGVSLDYSYTFQTPLASVVRLFGGSGSTTLSLSDKTIMSLNPNAN